VVTWLVQHALLEEDPHSRPLEEDPHSRPNPTGEALLMDRRQAEMVHLIPRCLALAEPWELVEVCLEERERGAHGSKETWEAGNRAALEAVWQMLVTP